MLLVALVPTPNDLAGCGERRVRIEPDPQKQAGACLEAHADDDIGASHRDVGDHAIGLIAIGAIDGHHHRPLRKEARPRAFGLVHGHLSKV